MSEKKIPEKEPKTEETNPFLSTFGIDCKVITSRRDNPATFGTMVSTRYVDSDYYVAVYPKHLFKIMKQLTGSSPIMMFYILSKLGNLSEKIELREDKVRAECEFSHNTFKRAMVQLESLSIIITSTSRKNTYWINPALFFRGSRMSAFPANVNFPKKQTITL